MSELVKTFRVVRRQDMGGGVFRENGELLPEAHLSGQTAHYVHQGALEEYEAPVEEFVEAVRKYCPQLAPQLADAVGARGQQQATGEVRASAMVPSSLPAYATDATVSTPELQRAILEAGRSHVSIRSEDNPEAAYAPVVGPLPQEEFQMVQPTEGAKNVYEDASTVDPAALNEALTGTRPEDLANQDAEAAYKLPQPGGPVEATGVAEHPFSDPIGSTPSGAVGDGTINPETAEGDEGDAGDADTTEGADAGTAEPPAGDEGDTGEPSATEPGWAEGKPAQPAHDPGA